MGNDLATLPRDRAIDVLRQQIAPNASDAELAYFAQVCQRLDLSPFADQIVLIGRFDRRLNREVHRHQITVAGRRTLAARTGRLAGIEGPVWCGPRERGELVWRDVWDEDVPPYCARVLVHVHGWQVPSNGTAKWSEFVQTTKDGTPLPMWQRMPAHMLGKVAESIALRRAFPDVIDPAALEGSPVPLAEDQEELAELNEAAPSPPPFDVERFRLAVLDAGLDVADVLAHAQIDRPLEQLTEQDRPALKEAIAALAEVSSDAP